MPYDESIEELGRDDLFELYLTLQQANEIKEREIKKLQEENEALKAKIEELQNKLEGELK